MSIVKHTLVARRFGPIWAFLTLTFRPYLGLSHADVSALAGKPTVTASAYTIFGVGSMVTASKPARRKNYRTRK